MLIGWLLFIFYLAFDILYARFLFAFNNSKAVEAGLYSAVITVMGIFGFIEANKNLWNIIPIALGCFIGTFLSVKFRKKSES
jgi:hypothetical protein